MTNNKETAALAIKLLVATEYNQDLNDLLNNQPAFVNQANNMFEENLLGFDETGTKVVPTQAFYKAYADKKPMGVNYKKEAVNSLSATMAMAEAVLESLDRHTAENNPRKITIHKGAGLYKLLVRMQTGVNNLLSNLELIPTQAAQPAF